MARGQLSSPALPLLGGGGYEIYDIGIKPIADNKGTVIWRLPDQSIYSELYPIVSVWSNTAYCAYRYSLSFTSVLAVATWIDGDCGDLYALYIILRKK